MATYTWDPITSTYILSTDQSFSVSTDQPDYSPGSTVQITATFDPGSTVQLTVAHDVGAGADGIWGTADDILSYDLMGTGLAWTVTADANGLINASWFVNQDALGQAFVLTATDQMAGLMATASFTDTSTPIDATPVSVNQASFFADTDPTTGTGVVESFLRVQNTPQEQGYNTGGEATNTILDDKGGNFTDSIRLAQVPIVLGDGTHGTTAGVEYREFRLDLNEDNSTDSPP